jgi:hypothetical protein
MIFMNMQLKYSGDFEIIIECTYSVISEACSNISFVKLMNGMAVTTRLYCRQWCRRHSEILSKIHLDLHVKCQLFLSHLNKLNIVNVYL